MSDRRGFTAVRPCQEITPDLLQEQTGAAGRETSADDAQAAVARQWKPHDMQRMLQEQLLLPWKPCARRHAVRLSLPPGICVGQSERPGLHGESPGQAALLFDPISHPLWITEMAETTGLRTAEVAVEVAAVTGCLNAASTHLTCQTPSSLFTQKVSFRYRGECRKSRSRFCSCFGLPEGAEIASVEAASAVQSSMERPPAD
ncbi:unnamed protein product [Lota lota]